MRVFRQFVLLVCAVIWLGACGDESSAPYQPGDEISLRSHDGRLVELIRREHGFVLKGAEHKVILFDLFGTFCPPCQSEAPYLSALQNELQDDLIIIGLAYFEKKSTSKLQDFARVYGASYFMSNDDAGDKLVQSILDDISYPDAVALPLKVMLKDGQYMQLRNAMGAKTQNKFYLGMIKTSVIKQDIKDILKEKK